MADTQAETSDPVDRYAPTYPSQGPVSSTFALCARVVEESLDGKSLQEQQEIIAQARKQIPEVLGTDDRSNDIVETMHERLSDADRSLAAGEPVPTVAKRMCAPLSFLGS